MTQVRQVGGTHYDTGEGRPQHWDIVERLGVGYMEAQGSRYLLRAHRKGRWREDMEKALSFVEKLILQHTEEGRVCRNYRATSLADIIAVEKLCRDCGVSQQVGIVVTKLLDCWVGSTLDFCARQIRRMLREGQPGTPEDGGHHASEEDGA